MASVNKVILVGNVGRDPEVKYSASGTAVANFTLATTEQWKDKDGSKQEKVEWHKCVTWKRLAEIIGEYVKKGSSLYVEGRLQTRQWDDKEGNKRYTTEIVVQSMQMLSGKKQENAASSGPEDGPVEIPDDDIPF